MNRWTIGLVAAVVVCLGTSDSANGLTVVNSPFDLDDGGDHLFRGFYVEDYGAENLGTVRLVYVTNEPGTWLTSLAVRLDAYDGTLVGTDTLSTSFEAGVSQEVVYDFGGVSVPVGSLLTFKQEILDSPRFASIFYDVGSTPHPQITQTTGTTPPLGTFRRGQVGVIITAVPEPGTFGLFALAVLAAITAICRSGRKL